jgi:UDP-GlcNAc:undecaprenyl-phosphate GlcNAc-1-phosphate transferase
MGAVILRRAAHRMTVPILILAAVSFAISWVLTGAMKRVAPKVGLVDRPGARKIHQDPKPLGGGVAIFLSLALPMLATLAVVNFAGNAIIERFQADPRFANVAALVEGGQYQTPMTLGLLGGMLALHAVGLLDDRRALGPFGKLFVQVLVAAAFVVIYDVRALTALDKLWGPKVGYVASVLVTVFWIVAVTNAFNFLDNMDGLSAGVAAVCATAFLITALSIGQWFVAAAIALLLGAVLGFLCFNFPPATIFMGDSGSLVIGFLLGVLTVRTTFLTPGTDWGAGWYAVFAPVIVLAVPMYDMLTVLLLRVMRGKNPFIGDTNHFSHRLVARGMSRRTAVLCIYLVTAATSMAAILLPHVSSTFGAMVIFGQTILVLGVVALLEQHPLPPSPGTPEEGRGEGRSAASSNVEQVSATESGPHPSPLPGYRERG